MAPRVAVHLLLAVTAVYLASAVAEDPAPKCPPEFVLVTQTSPDTGKVHVYCARAVPAVTTAKPATKAPNAEGEEPDKMCPTGKLVRQVTPQGKAIYICYVPLTTPTPTKPTAKPPQQPQPPQQPKTTQAPPATVVLRSTTTNKTKAFKLVLTTTGKQQICGFNSIFRMMVINTCRYCWATHDIANYWGNLLIRDGYAAKTGLGQASKACQKDWKVCVVAGLLLKYYCYQSWLDGRKAFSKPGPGISKRSIDEERHQLEKDFGELDLSDIDAFVIRQGLTMTDLGRTWNEVVESHRSRRSATTTTPAPTKYTRKSRNKDRGPLTTNEQTYVYNLLQQECCHTTGGCSAHKQRYYCALNLKDSR